MGQGLNTKALQVAATTLGSVLGGPIDLSKIRFADPGTSVIPNDNSGTGGSTGSESVVAAVGQACQLLADKLKNVLETIVKETEEKAKKEAAEAKEGKTPQPEEGKGAFKVTWENLCKKADDTKVLLSSQARWGLEGGCIAYHNYGAGFSEVEVDVLTGEVNIVKSELVYDCGKSLNPAIDIGQVEGAFVFGIGHMLCEREVFDPDGRLVAEGTWIYKPPGVKGIPQEFNVELLQNEDFTRGVLSSKSSGEPPLVLSTSVAMAVREAIFAARKDQGNNDWFRLDLPLTPDVIQEACLYSDKQLSF
jgi:xanthine dehydrogenase molybdopterin-binding subunit B